MDRIGDGFAADRRDESQPVVIELELSEEWSPPAAPAASARPTWWLTIILAPLLVLGLVTSGERKETLQPVFQLAAGTQQRELIGDLLYVTAGSPAQFRAYHVVKQRLLWSRPTEATGLEWHRYRETIAVTGTDPATGSPVVEAIDGPTGKRLWHQRGLVLVGGGAGTVVARQVPDRGGLDGPSTLLGLDRRTGATNWSQPLRGGTATFVVQTTIGRPGEVGAHVIVSDPAGAVRALDASTGDLRVGPTAAQWHLDRSVPDPREAPTMPCIVYLSGVQAGSADSRAICLPSDIRSIMIDVAGKTSLLLGGTQARNRSVEVDKQGTITVTDSRTGEVIRALRGWSEAGALDNGQRLVVAQATENPTRRAGTGATGVNGPGPGRTSRADQRVLAVVDPYDGDLSVLGVIPAGMGTPSCSGAGGYLLCIGDSQLGVWRLGQSALA